MSKESPLYLGFDLSTQQLKGGRDHKLLSLGSS